MNLKVSAKLDLPDGRKALTLNGSCRIGHRRRCSFVQVEAPVCIGERVILESPFVGMGTFIGQGTTIRRTQSVGRFVTIGENCRIGAENLDFQNVVSTGYPARDKSLEWCKEFFHIQYPLRIHPKRKTVIGNDVFIGDSSIIYQGVCIGDGAVLAPGTVAYADVAPYSIVYGNPAFVYGTRFQIMEIKELMQLKWWDYGMSLLEKADMEKDGIHKLIYTMKEEISKCKKISVMNAGISFQYMDGKYKIFSHLKGEKELLFQTPDR